MKSIRLLDEVINGQGELSLGELRVADNCGSSLFEVVGGWVCKQVCNKRADNVRHLSRPSFTSSTRLRTRPTRHSVQ